jgi:hypothetical protein
LAFNEKEENRPECIVHSGHVGAEICESTAWNLTVSFLIEALQQGTVEKSQI